MSVVSGGKIIFCEGKDTSLDYQLLSKIISDISGDQCTIVGVGGKFNFSLFSKGYLTRNQTTNKRYIFFSDRDFDVQPTSNIQLLQLVNRESTILSYRACIENYLLDANLIHNYWLEKFQKRQEYPTTTWGLWTEKQYLIWFHGKDIQKEMQRQQNKYISLNKEFFKWAIQNLDINQHPDLIELRERINNL